MYHFPSFNSTPKSRLFLLLGEIQGNCDGELSRGVVPLSVLPLQCLNQRAFTSAPSWNSQLPNYSPSLFRLRTIQNNCHCERIFYVCYTAMLCNQASCSFSFFIMNKHACSVASVMTASLWSYGLHHARLLCPLDFPGKRTGVSCHAFLQGIFPTQGMNPPLLCLLHWVWILYRWATREAPTVRLWGNRSLIVWSIVVSFHGYGIL